MGTAGDRSSYRVTAARAHMFGSELLTQNLLVTFGSTAIEVCGPDLLQPLPDWPQMLQPELPAASRL